ncbi:MAG: PqqD family protein [Deinococcales bacterium]
MTRAPNPEILVTDLDNELVLLNPRTQAMFTLNGTGRIVWQNLGKYSATEIAEKIVERFEIDLPTALKDTENLLETLANAGLLV